VQRTTEPAEVLDNIPGLVVVLSAEGTLEFINRQVKEYFGLTLEHLKGWITSDAIHPDDLPHTISTLRNAIKTGHPYTLDHRLRRHDGAYRWFHDDGIPIRDADGCIVNWYVLFTDVHERKTAEEKLRYGTRALASIIDTIPGIVMTATPEGDVEFVNKGALEYFGGTLEDLKRWAVNGAVYQDDLVYVVPKWRRSVETGEGYNLDHRCRRADGEYRWFHSSALPLHDADGQLARWYVLLTDIHERKTAEEELRRSEQSLHEAQKLSHTGSWKYVLSGAITVSPEMGRIFGVDSDDYMSGTEYFFKIFHPEDRKRVENLFEQSVTQKTDFQADYRINRQDGAIRHLHTVGHPIVNQSGDVVEFFGTTVDVTEHWEARTKLEKAFEELQRSEMYLHEAQKLSHTGSWRFEVSSGATIVSPEMLRIFGVDPSDDAPSTDFLMNRFHPEDRARATESFERGLAEAKDFETDYRIVLPDGKIRHIHSIGHPVVKNSGELVEFIGTIIDVTEQWQARTELESAFEEIKRLRDRLQDENVALREEIIRSSMFEEIVGSSQPLRMVLEQVTRVAPTDSTVLISGETGTGKELIARAIHKGSTRSARAFISVNCGAIPQSLIASELFGHEKGAFTGAMQRRIGCFEAANGGTLFLDEVGDLPIETQVALLRVLQEREFERIGGAERVKVDVRVLAATNRDLKRAASTGAFRADLFYRLNVFPIEVPPLRYRVDDIPVLVGYLIDRYAKKAGKKFSSIGAKTLEAFQKYDWPGNIRELQNVIERAVVICDGPVFSIDEMWLRTESAPASAQPTPMAAVASDGEKELIEQALAQCRGRVSGPSGAAAKLGIPRQTLESKIQRLGINKHQFRT